MSTNENVKTIQAMYDAFGRGDVAGLVEHVADEVRWVVHLDPIVPWSGDFSGKANVPRFFEAIFQNADEHVFVPGEWIVDGDRVVSLGTYACRSRATGKQAKAHWVFLWTLKDGMVTSYDQYQGPGLAEAFR
jgi:ketosteroid isomerase-like protein